MKKIIMSIIIGLLAVVFILPLLLTFFNSFMEPGQIKSQYETIINGSSDGSFNGLTLLPKWISLKQYYQVLFLKPEFLKMFWNSVVMVFSIIVGQVMVSSLAAYGFSKVKFKFRELIFYIYILLMLLPFQVTVVPNYLIANYFGLIDRYESIIFMGVFHVFGVFLLRQFMKKIPEEYIEAAKLDGANHFQIFTRIILPMSKNYIASLAVLLLIEYWNMVEQPLIFLKDSKKYPLSLYLSQIGKSEFTISFAASMIYTIPVILIYLYAEKYFVEGVKNSGLKG